MRTKNIKKKWPETLACHKNLLLSLENNHATVLPLLFSNFCTVSIIKRLNYFPFAVNYFLCGQNRVQAIAVLNNARDQGLATSFYPAQVHH